MLAEAFRIPTGVAIVTLENYYAPPLVGVETGEGELRAETGEIGPSCQ